MTPRHFLVKATLLTLALVAATSVRAEWPERPIHIVVPFAPGVSGDIIVRLVSDGLAKRLGQPIVVDNREGAAGNIGTMAVARAAPDGYTLLVASTANFVINQHLYRSFSIDPLTAFAPIIQLADVPSLLVTSLSLPANDFQSFVAYARGHKGQINFGTPGIGTPGHLTIEALNRSLGLGVTSLPYKGASQVLTAVVSGELDVGFALPGVAAQYIQNGKLRPLAVLGQERIALLPDTPSLGELGFGNAGGVAWWAMVAPAGTPEPITQRMNAAMREAMSAPAARKRLEELGIVPAAGTREELATKLTRDAAIWSRVIKELGIPPQ